MDAVKSFNNELTQLYEAKPPISKAKMTSITRTAIKAIKFYKHVVQSVEKFIMKCKPEYKVPGLYVIDSIVRQSRHQFGPDKDVFAPRFAKNMQLTFSNLFSCPPEEKGKIIRVLNLWQKNQVFTPDVIQPLFDQLADPANPIHRDPGTPTNGVPSEAPSPPPIQYKPAPIPPGPPSNTKVSNTSEQTSPSWMKVAQNQIEAANKAILELSGVAGLLGQQQKSTSASGVDILQQLQHLQQLILSQTPQKQEKTDQVLFDKKLLEFDYDDEDDENTSPHQPPNNDSLNNILQNPEILKSLTAIQQHMSQAQLRQQQLEEEKMRKLREMKQQEEEFDKHLAQTVHKLPFASECDFKQMGDIGMMGVTSLQDMDTDVECIELDVRQGRNVEVINIDRSPTPNDSRRDSRSRSKSRHGRRSTSRSRSRSARRRRHRTRSRSRNRHRDRDRERDKERDRTRDRGRQAESAKDKERRKKGLPPIKKAHLSVCSTTLWIGHLSKLVQQEDLSDTFGEFGEIVSIDLIPPRGCAFVCMNRRQDASRALNRLNDHKIHGKSITMAWAPGKGVKGRELKDFWEVELGVSYIPWTRLRPNTNFVDLEEGGHLDEETMPNDLKSIILEQLKKHKDNKGKDAAIPGEEQTGFPPPGMDVMNVPPVILAAMPGLNVPPPGMPPVPPSANIDTSQPPPGLPLPPGMPPQGLPVMGKPPGLVLPPFPFNNLPPPLGMSMANILGSLQLGVPPPGMLLPQGLIPHPLLPPPTVNTPNLETVMDPSKVGTENRPKEDDRMDIDEDTNDSKKKFRDNQRDWPQRNDRRKDGPWGREKDEKRWQGRDSWDRSDRHRDRSRNRSRSRDRDRDRDSRRRSRERSKPRDDMGLGPWVDASSSASASDGADKPSLSQRLRSLADGEPAVNDRPGPPMVNNNSNSSVPTAPFVTQTPPTDRGLMFNDRQIRSLFDGPPINIDDVGGPMPIGMLPPQFDDMLGGPRAIFENDRFDGPPSLLGGPPINPFMNDFSPRMRFGPPPSGPGPMFGPRGPRPRHLSPWIDNQGPPMGPRPHFDDRRRDRDGRNNDRDWRNNDRNRNMDRDGRNNDRNGRNNERDARNNDRDTRNNDRDARNNDRDARNNDRDTRNNDRDARNNDRDKEIRNNDRDNEIKNNHRDGKSVRKRDRDGPRTSRWSKDESVAAKEEVAVMSTDEKPPEAVVVADPVPEPVLIQDEAKVEHTESIPPEMMAVDVPVRDMHTPVFDEPSVPHVPEPTSEVTEEGGGTPCHDEPAVKPEDF